MTSKRRLLLLSTSKIYGTEYLEFAAGYIRDFLNKSKVKKVVFIPYAVVDYDDYVKKVRDGFKNNKLDFEVYGIHERQDPVKAVKEADAIFIGGGNTFLLLKTLYSAKVVELIRERVMKDITHANTEKCMSVGHHNLLLLHLRNIMQNVGEGVPYMGSSAGTNVATINICTTNDMPIVYVPTLSAINLVPFNINPHYLDPDPNSTHMGETREMRIKEYQQMPESKNVLGLREGSLLNVEGDKATLIGKPTARVFIKGKDAVEYPDGSDLSFLLK